MNTANPAVTPARRAAPMLLLLPLVLATGLSAQTAPAAAAADGEPAVELSPFQVNSSQDRGYLSTNSLSGTRTNEPLRELSNSISVMNRELLEDLAVTDFFEAVEFAVGAENVDGIAGGANNNLIVRGLQTNFQSRDGFRSFVPLDNFNTERIELNRGASGILFGDPAAGGILNNQTKQAQLRNFGTVQLRFDEWGGRRASLDWNRQLTKTVAVRLNTLYSDLRDWRDEVYTEDTALAAAISWRPSRKTIVRLDGEWTQLNRNQGHFLMQDQYSAYVPGTGSTAIDVDAVTAGVQQTVGTNQLRAAGNNQRWTYAGGTLYNLESTTGATGRTYRQSNITTNSVPLNPRNIPVVTVPPSVIPYDQMWRSPRVVQDRDFYFYTFAVEHHFSDQFAILFQHNVQNQLNTTLAAGGGNNTPQLRRDPNPFLPNPNGTGEIANPYFDQLYLEHNISDTIVKNIDRNYRLTAIYDFELKNTRHRAIGSVSYRDASVVADTHAEVLSAGAIASRGLTGAAAQFQNNQIFRRYYLRDGRSDAALAAPQSGDTYMYADGGFWRRSWDDLATGSLMLNSHFFKNRLHTSAGIVRNYFNEDRNNPNSAADPRASNTPARVAGTNEATPWLDADGNLIRVNYKDTWTTIYNYGAVFDATPWLSVFYNYSESNVFNTPGTYFNTEVAPPQEGESQDWGFRLNLFEEKLYAAVSFFTGEQTNFFQNGLVSAAMAAEMNALLSPSDGITYGSGPDSRDRDTKGYEIEVVANPSQNLTVRAVLSVTGARDTAFYPRLMDAYRRMVALNVDSSLYQNTASAVANIVEGERINRYRPSLVARYRFPNDSRFRGFSTGVSVRWTEGVEQDAAVVNGITVLPAFKTPDYYIWNPFVSYTRRIGKYTYTGQLNVNNALDEIVRLGGWGNGRLTPPRQVIFTGTMRF